MNRSGAASHQTIALLNEGNKLPQIHFAGKVGYFFSYFCKQNFNIFPFFRSACYKNFCSLQDQAIL